MPSWSSGLLVLLFIFFLSWLTYDAMKDPVYDRIADKCSDEYITWKIGKINHDMKNKNRLAKRQFDGITRLENALSRILTGDDPEVKEIYLKYTLLAQNKCAIPPILEEQHLIIRHVVENAGDRACPKNSFYKQSVVELKNLKYYKPSLYKSIMAQAEKQLISLATDDALLSLLKKKWASKDFRDRLILMHIQTQKRRRLGCKDVNLPAMDIQREIFRLSRESY